MKAYLLIDIDGVLNPYAAKRNQRPAGYHTVYVSSTENNYTVYEKKKQKHGGRWEKNVTVWLNESHGTMLLDLADSGYTLVWATSWENNANLVISPRLHLPELPYVPFPDKTLGKLHYKNMPVADYVGDTPFVWLDDAHTPLDREDMVNRCPQPHMLYSVNPAVGFTQDDVNTLKKWLDWGE